MSFAANPLLEQIRSIDNQLSKRPLALDPLGYVLIYVDREQQLLGVKVFSTVINEQGLATDPATGKVIPARGPVQRDPIRTYTGRTAKEVCVAMFEQGDPCLSQLSHAAYVGRELQRAEFALCYGLEYVQD
ncbi:MAG: DUF4346 domain-containing protein [Thermostichales cyanobacterium SZTDM-1c_bins_54]